MVLRTIVCLLLAGGVVSSQAAPTVDELRKKAGDYIAQYSEAVSGVTLEEQFLLVQTTGGNTRVPIRIASDVTLFVLDQFAIGLRDVYSIDTRPVRERQPRVINALKEPAGPNIELVRRYIRENAAHLLHNVVVWYTDPLLALQFGAPANQAKITYKLEGNKKMNGVQVAQLHAVDRFDMDGDGLKDIVTGKRYWAHGPTGDINPTDPPALYWFKLVRKGGTASFEPRLIDNDSGIGVQVVAADVNGDKYPDIIVGNKKGIFVHIGEAKKVSKEEYEKQAPKPVTGQ